MKSLISHLGTTVFDRVKIGIDRPRAGMTVVNHVLSPFAKEDLPTIAASIDKAVAACEFYLENQDFTATMNHFN